MSTEEEDNNEKIARLQEVQRQYRLNVIKEQNQRNAVIRGLHNMYPNIDGKELIKTSYDVVLKNKNDTIKINDKEIKVADMQFMLAESIELICSGTNSVQEYFSWFEDCNDIMVHMNDGFISEADLEERNGWVSYSYTREAEILTCLGLYKSSSYPLAEKKYDFLYNKLIKLRQMRSAIIESTIGTRDEMEKKNEESRKESLNYTSNKTESVSVNANNVLDFSSKVLRNIDIYHGFDKDSHEKLGDSYVHDKGFALDAPEEQYMLGAPKYILDEAEEQYMLGAPEKQEAFDEDLKKTFAISLKKQHFEELSAAEELLALPPHIEETRKSIEERIHRLRKRCVNSDNKRHKKFFDAMRYRNAFSKSGNMM